MKCIDCDADAKFGKSTRNPRCAYHEQTRKWKKESLAKKDNTLYVPKITKDLVERRKDDWLVNLIIWESRPRVCVECDRDLNIHGDERPPKSYFSHLISKGAHCGLRHVSGNIVLHCGLCHQKWETSGRRHTMKTFYEYYETMVALGWVPSAFDEKAYKK